jgi:hypothetical protein
LERWVGGSTAFPSIPTFQYSIIPLVRRRRPLVGGLFVFLPTTRHSPRRGVPFTPLNRLFSSGGRQGHDSLLEIGGQTSAMAYPPSGLPSAGSEDHPRGRVGLPNAIFSRLGSRCYMPSPPFFRLLSFFSALLSFGSSRQKDKMLRLGGTRDSSVHCLLSSDLCVSASLRE